MLRALAVCAIVFPAVLAAEAAEPQEGAKPVFFTGTLAKPEDTSKLTATMGRSGVLLIRSQERWEAIQKRCPDLTSDRPVKVDFAKRMMVMAFDSDRRKGDSWRMAPAKGGGAMGKAGPGVMLEMYWHDREEEQREFRYALFGLAVVAAADSVEVGITSQPMEPDPNHRPVKELSAVLGKEVGDIVDGLQGKITAKNQTIKPGEDILIDFELHLADMSGAKADRMLFAPEKVHVWDGKYSNGYRNHGFYVTLPDGKTVVLRPEVIRAWEKNAPHPEGITAKKGYHLPNWVGGDTYKSLKALGLDTSAAGTYTITGFYEETAEEAGPGNRGTAIWGGSITTSPLRIIAEVSPSLRPASF